MGIGKVEDSKVKGHGMEEAAWPGRQLIYWKNYRFSCFPPLWIMASDCCPVVSAQLNLCPNHAGFRGHSDTQHMCTPFVQELKFNKCHCRQQHSLTCLEICKGGYKLCGNCEDAVQGTKCKARTREPRVQFVTLSHSCSSECFHVD